MYHLMIWACPNIGQDSDPIQICVIFPQALLLVPALVRIVHSSPRMVHVCAEPVSSSTMNWILKAPALTVNWTASLRSVAGLKSGIISFILSTTLSNLHRWTVHPNVFSFKNLNL